MTTNLNVPRLDDGAPLTETDIGIRASWPVPPLKLVPPSAPQPAEASTDIGADQAPRRSWLQRRAPDPAAAWAVAVIFVLSGYLMGILIATAFEAVRGWLN